jgi:hypothetical protein
MNVTNIGKYVWSSVRNSVEFCVQDSVYNNAVRYSVYCSMLGSIRYSVRDSVKNYTEDKYEYN